METRYQVPNAFKALKFVHVGLLIGMSIFALVALAVRRQGLIDLEDESLERILQVICVIISLISVVAGFNIFKRKIILARLNTESGIKRMDRYRTACIIWWAMIEWPGMVALVGYLVTGNLAFFALAIFHILILLVFMPRKDNIVVLLQLTSSDVDKLEGKQ